LNLHSLAGT